MGVAVLTLQGGGQALLSNKVSVEYPSIDRCHLPRPSPRSPPESGYRSASPLFRRAEMPPPGDSPPRVQSGAQWNRWLGRVSAARGASFVSSAAPGARGPRPTLWIDKAGAAANRAGSSAARASRRPACSLLRPLIGPSRYNEAGERAGHVGWRGFLLVDPGCLSRRAGSARSAGSLPPLWGPPAGPAACQREVAMVRPVAAAAAAAAATASLVGRQGGEDDWPTDRMNEWMAEPSAPWGACRAWAASPCCVARRPPPLQLPRRGMSPAAAGRRGRWSCRPPRGCGTKPASPSLRPRLPRRRPRGAAPRATLSAEPGLRPRQPAPRRPPLSAPPRHPLPPASRF